MIDIEKKNRIILLLIINIYVLGTYDWYSVSQHYMSTSMVYCVHITNILLYELQKL